MSVVSGKTSQRPALGELGARVRLQMLPPLVLFLMAMGVWEWAARQGMIARVVLPAPSVIWQALVSSLQEPFFWNHFSITMQETWIGYALGVGAGFILGGMTALSSLWRSMILPYAVLIDSMPKIILAPLTLIWFGYGITSKIVLVVLIVFFPVYLNTVSGLASTKHEEIELMRTCKASRLQTFRMVQFPNALPYIFVGLKNGLVGAFIGAIVGEFVGASAGLGVLVKTYNEQLRIEYVYAVIIVMSVLSLSFFLLLEFLDKKIVFWRNAD